MRERFDDVQCVVSEAMCLDQTEFRELQLSLRRLTSAVRAATEH